jgi:lysophospholipase L1-like esterase
MDTEHLNLAHLEFHNILAPEPWDFGEGWLLPRYPRSVRESMNERGRLASREATGVEIRFVTSAPNLRVYLTSPEVDAEVVVYCGDFHHSTHQLAAGVRASLCLNPPERFGQVRTDALRRGPFSPQVWRVIGSRSALLFHGIESFGHFVRPPAREEKPRRQWLAYGSSITHSSWQGYPRQAAWRLGVDVLNKGLGGSCHVENTTADYLARQCQWDFATLEMGINMRGLFPPEEFERRARYMVEELTTAKPGCPVVLITVYPNFAAHMEDGGVALRNERAYNEILRGLAKEFAGRHVHLVEGAEVVREFSDLSADLLHPSAYGHARMGENLANLLRPIIGEA